MKKPHLKIKNKFQKRKYLYSDILTKDILKDICKKATGFDDFTVEFDNSGYNTTASMQRDFMDGKPSELENFNGYVVKQGLLLGIETPINSFIYHCLLPQENKARE